MLHCPPGADRKYDMCLLDCPLGTTKNFDLCVPECPPGFVTTQDGLSCQAEFTKRLATVREACYANETRIAGSICLAPCAAGTVPLKFDSEMCFATLPVNLRPFFWSGQKTFGDDIAPIIAKIVFSRTQAPATCATDFEPTNGQCFSKCPIGSLALGLECVADCPKDFKSVANQSACLRPTRRRQVIVSTLSAIGDAIKKAFFGIVGIMLISFLSSFF